MNENCAQTHEFFLRIYYEDTDTGGIVFYANYLKFFERARTEWLRAGSAEAAGVSQQLIADELGLMFVVRSTAVEYKRPARLDDRIVIVSRIARLGRAGVDFYQEAWLCASGGAPGDDARELLAIGRIKVACVARGSMRPAAIPETIRTIFGATP